MYRPSWKTRTNANVLQVETLSHPQSRILTHKVFSMSASFALGLFVSILPSGNIRTRIPGHYFVLTKHLYFKWVLWNGITGDPAWESDHLRILVTNRLSKWNILTPTSYIPFVFQLSYFIGQSLFSTSTFESTSRASKI
jgi:hypothetical protein